MNEPQDDPHPPRRISKDAHEIPLTCLRSAVRQHFRRNSIVATFNPSIAENDNALAIRIDGRSKMITQLLIWRALAAVFVQTSIR